MSSLLNFTIRICVPVVTLLGYLNKVMADAKGYKLSADLAKVDVDKIKGRFYANVVK